jgi:hypothetical protein
MQLLGTKIVKAKRTPKPQRCNACNKVIEVGTKKVQEVVRKGNYFQTTKYHKECYEEESVRETRAKENS